MKKVFPIGVQVKSSNLDAVAYDEANGILAVRFKDQEGYVYRNVPKTVWKALLESDSHGSYFSTKIRNSNSYPWELTGIQFGKIISLKEYLDGPVAKPFTVNPEEMKTLANLAWW